MRTSNKRVGTYEYSGRAVNAEEVPLPNYTLQTENTWYVT